MYLSLRGKEGRKGHHRCKAEMEEMQNGTIARKSGCQRHKSCQKMGRSHGFSEETEEFRDCLFTLVRDREGQQAWCWKPAPVEQAAESRAAGRKQDSCTHRMDRGCPVVSDSSWRGDRTKPAGLFTDVNKAL